MALAGTTRLRDVQVLQTDLEAEMGAQVSKQRWGSPPGSFPGSNPVQASQLLPRRQCHLKGD